MSEAREKPKPVTAPIERFAVENGELVIGGVPLGRLARRIGATPFFAYDRALISGRIAKLRAELPDGVHLNYAMKANPMPAVVQHAATLVDGIDVASALELNVALDTAMPRERISFAGPGKTGDEIARAVAAGIVFNLESENEMETVARHAVDQGVVTPVAIRVNPDFELKTSGMRMSGGPKQFGVDAERVPAMLRRLGELDMLAFRGFHIFSGSQNLRSEALVEAQTNTVALAIDLARHAPGPLHHLNIGGGFGIPYFPGDTPLDLAPIADNLAGLMDRVRSELGAPRVVIELGRYIVGEAGIYVSRIVDRKISRGRVFLITDGGLHHQLAASGNFGQVIRKNYPVAIGNRMGEPAVETADVVGCLCTPLDLLGDKVELPEAQVGDLFVVFQSGAYGLTASPTAFLSHPAPVEVLV
ncbi:MAG: pyridoxal-dependent decarboxylase, exosortase A system-associated [Rhodospirillaceae bacterium]